ncbi:peptide chain release factor N(5)-glutamine methyltransferase [Pelagibacterium xiamenense]|uniref:peptide chain release factor N(5)-glutamine methyltransferase n=1 Tax=Pelagibacterium xiamenense TaxID=2901140 RepID=UPI001E63A894|nr:peptide chain release factor N(5)-glutamine methyltransferase [Pelagibacterium xiamenense]MCD7061237.1 peptide chain release factor N(5)-glutamine methyltransferase [Pelagibacterium xiamenense]
MARRPTIGQAWRAGRDRLSAAGLESPARDAQVLMRHVLGIDQTRLILSEPDPIPAEAAQRFDDLIARRTAREPVARIVGRQEFYGLSFGLNAATLVPRPETEMLVDFGIERLKDKPGARVLDLGTGTGCILLALLANLPGAVGVGIDLAEAAATQARENALALDVSGRAAIRTGAWFAPVADGELFDLIVSNPPYIATAILRTLEKDVRDYDPALALDGGEDGLGPYRILAAEAGRFLEPGGAVALEIGFDQGAAVTGLLQEAGFVDVTVERDLAGHDRMVTARQESAGRPR